MVQHHIKVLVGRHRHTAMHTARYLPHTPKYRECLADYRCDNIFYLRVLRLRVLLKDTTKCILQSKRSSFVIARSLPGMLTTTIADLFIDVSVPDTYHIPNPSSHRVMTLKEVRLRHCKTCASV